MSSLADLHAHTSGVVPCAGIQGELLFFPNAHPCAARCTTPELEVDFRMVTQPLSWLDGGSLLSAPWPPLVAAGTQGRRPVPRLLPSTL